MIIDDISKSSSSTAAATPIYVPTISSTAEAQSQSHSLQDVSVAPTPCSVGTGASTSGSSSSERLPLAPPPAPQQQQQLSTGSGSFKQRFRRGSSKKRRPQPGTSSALEDGQAQMQEEEEDHQHLHLNNGSGSSSGAKETNRLSPQNSIRRLSNTLSIASGPPMGGAYGAGSRRASACIFNSQVYQNLNQPPKLRPGSGQRRMSSIELAFSKTSHLNLHNLEANRKSLSYTNSKMDLDKWNKSYGNLNDPDNMLQQYMEARDKRKNSISHYNLKKRLEEKELQQLQQLHQQQLLQQRQDSFSSASPQQQSGGGHRLSKDQQQQQLAMQPHSISMVPHGGERVSKLRMLIEQLTPKHFTTEREDYSLYIFPEDNRWVI